jgi:hypothetical protein
MFDFESIGRAEHEFGFRYPPAFLAAAPTSEKLVATPAFASAFPQTQMVPPQNLAEAWAGRCPRTLVPFMSTGRPAFADHYCFHKCPVLNSPTSYIAGPAMRRFALVAVDAQDAGSCGFLKWVLAPVGIRATLTKWRLLSDILRCTVSWSSGRGPNKERHLPGPAYWFFKGL